MIKNKKIVSLLCTIAMIFTMLSGLTIASADGASITLSNPVLSDDAKTATVDINYAGIEGGVAAGSIKIQMPAEVTKVTADPTASVVNLADDGMFTYNFALGANATTDAAGKLTTLTITLSEGLAEAKEIKIADGSYVGPGPTSKYTVGATEETDKIKMVTSNTVSIPADPSAPTPKPTTDATPAPVATEKPSEGPELDPPVSADTAGLNFGTPVKSDDGLTVTLPITYIGIEGGVAAGSVKIQMPAEVTKVTADPTASVVNLADDGMFTYNFALGANATTDAAGTLTTLTLTLSKAFEDDTQLTFADGSYVGPGPTKKYTVNGTASDKVITIPASNVIIEGSSEEVEPQDVVDTVDLSDAITKTVTDTPDGTSKESEYFIIPKVTVVDPETKEVVDAEYGEQGDYVAVIGDTVLTPAQYSNLINGHLGADNVKDIVAANNINNINDVISKIGLRVYNSTAKISAQLVNKSTGVIENADDEEIVVDNGSEVETKYKKPTLSVKASKTSTTVGSGDTITVTATYDFKDYADNATVAISAEGDTLDLATSSGFKIEYEQAEEAPLDLVTKIEDEVTLIDNIAEKGTIKITYKPGSVGTAKFTFAITGQNEAGTVLDQAVTGTASTKINKASPVNTPKKDSDNKSSGGGAIASGLVDSGSSYLPSLGFDDLGDVTWAQTAINTLAAKKIVSGVGDNKFDPNAALTRAAYAQMLVNAIGHSTDSADTYFDDVPTDAWFYHNVAVAAQLGIVSGFGDGTFRPNDLITREQMALMTQKAAVVMGKSLVGADAGTFTDDADIADWSRDAVYQLSNAGIINGMGDGTFAPQANATRAQAAVIIYNAFVK